MTERTRLYFALAVRHLARAVECVVLAVLMIFGSLAVEVRRVLAFFYTALVVLAVSRRVRALIVFTLLLALPFLFIETSHLWAVSGPAIPLRIPPAPSAVSQEQERDFALLPEVNEKPFVPPIEVMESGEADPVSTEPAAIVSEIELAEPELLFDNLEQPSLPVRQADDSHEETLPLAWEGMIEWDENVVTQPVEEQILLKVPDQEVLDQAVDEEAHAGPVQPPTDSNDLDFEREEPGESDPPLDAIDVAQPAENGENGVAALSVELSDRMDPVPVGADTEYEITVANQGTAEVTNVQLSLVVPSQLAVAVGTSSRSYRREEDRFVFEPLLSLSPRETTTLRVKFTAHEPGDVRMKLLIRADSFPDGFQEQESTRIYSEE